MSQSSRINRIGRQLSKLSNLIELTKNQSMAAQEQLQNCCNHNSSSSSQYSINNNYQYQLKDNNNEGRKLGNFKGSHHRNQNQYTSSKVYHNDKQTFSKKMEKKAVRDTVQGCGGCSQIQGGGASQLFSEADSRETLHMIDYKGNKRQKLNQFQQQQNSIDYDNTSSYQLYNHHPNILDQNEESSLYLMSQSHSQSIHNPPNQPRQRHKRGQTLHQGENNQRQNYKNIYLLQDNSDDDDDFDPANNPSKFTQTITVQGQIIPSMNKGSFNQMSSSSNASATNFNKDQSMIEILESSDVVKAVDMTVKKSKQKQRQQLHKSSNSNNAKHNLQQQKLQKNIFQKQRIISNKNDKMDKISRIKSENKLMPSSSSMGGSNFHNKFGRGMDLLKQQKSLNKKKQQRKEKGKQDHSDNHNHQSQPQHQHNKSNDHRRSSNIYHHPNHQQQQPSKPSSINNNSGLMISQSHQQKNYLSTKIQTLNSKRNHHQQSQIKQKDKKQHNNNNNKYYGSGSMSIVKSSTDNNKSTVTTATAAIAANGTGSVSSSNTNTNHNNPKNIFHLNLQKQVTMKITDLKIKKNLCQIETSYLSASVRVTKEELTRIQAEMVRQYSEENLLRSFILQSLINFISQYNDEAWTSTDENGTEVRVDDHELVARTLKHPGRFIKIINKLPDILRRRNIVSEFICKQFISNKAYIDQRLTKLQTKSAFVKQPLYIYLCQLHAYMEFLLNNNMIHETKRHKIFNPTAEQFFSERSTNDLKLTMPVKQASSTVTGHRSSTKKKDYSQRKKQSNFASTTITTTTNGLKRVNTSKALKKGISTKAKKNHRD